VLLSGWSVLNTDRVTHKLPLPGERQKGLSARFEHNGASREKFRARSIVNNKPTKAHLRGMLPCEFL
jgi:hypothetical protein